MSLRERMNQSLKQVKTINQTASQPISIERTLRLQNGINQAISVKQYDHLSRLLKLTLLVDDKNHLDLTDGEVVMVMKNSLNEVYRASGEIIDSTQGEVSFILKKEYLSVVGEMKCEVVKIWEGDNTLSFPIFNLTVIESIYDDSILSPNEDSFF